MRRLYEIAGEYAAFLDWLDEHEDEITAAGGELPPEAMALFDKLGDAFETKVERIALLMREIDAHALTAENESKRLDRLAQTRKNASHALRKYLLDALTTAKVRNVETALVKVWVQTNGSAHVEPIDRAKVPAEFLRQPEPVFDSAAAAHVLNERGLMPKKPGFFEFRDLGLLVRRGVHLRTK